MEMKVHEIANADGLCYKCKKHVMKECECFFGRLFINDQPERLNPEGAIIPAYYGNKFCRECKEENCICDSLTTTNT